MPVLGYYQNLSSPTRRLEARAGSSRVSLVCQRSFSVTSETHAMPQLRKSGMLSPFQCRIRRARCTVCVRSVSVSCGCVEEGQKDWRLSETGESVRVCTSLLLLHTKLSGINSHAVSCKAPRVPRRERLEIIMQITSVGPFVMKPRFVYRCSVVCHDLTEKSEASS